MGLGFTVGWVRINRSMVMRYLFTVGMFTAVIVFNFGCEKPLFPRNLPRTPYERYQRLHGQGRVESEENAYGGQQPALRERLRPLGAP